MLSNDGMFTTSGRSNSISTCKSMNVIKNSTHPTDITEPLYKGSCRCIFCYALNMKSLVLP